MKINFKYNIGNTVKLVKRPSIANMQLGNYVLESEFKPKEYKVSQCKCSISIEGKYELFYNLYAYLDENIQYQNWIPESDLEGALNEHEETIEFISHDKEPLTVGDIVLASVFYGDMKTPYLPPELSFSYVGMIIGFDYVITEKGSVLKYAIVEKDDEKRTQPTAYIVKNINEAFAYEYVKHCKLKRFNPIKEAEKKYSHHKLLLESVNLWNKVTEIYNNWNKLKPKSAKKSHENSKYVKTDPLKTNIKKLLKSLSDEEKEELRKQLSK